MSKVRGGEQVVRALEAEGVRFAFGIPGTHNTELYDALERSGSVTPVLVTDEQSASFMADAVSRTSDSLGVANVVPGAGVTHTLSGVAEALMDGIPMLVLTCGIRTDTGKAYQLHDIDQLSVLRPVVKGTFRPLAGAEIAPTIRRAAALARAGTPGPVAVEIPANLYLLAQEEGEGAAEPEPEPAPRASEGELKEAARLLASARRPVLYAGYGARKASAALVALAERLGAPVATTIQGKGVFPESHPLFLWNGLGAAAPPHVREATRDCDAMLAVGCRFGEVGTASYGMSVPEALVHVDVNPEVFHRNYKARLAVRSDAGAFLEGLLPLAESRPRDAALEKGLAEGRRRLAEERRARPSRARVTPARLFEALQAAAGEDAIYVTDSGNGTFLAMEHLRLEAPGRFIGPVDYSCMGYAPPAAVAAKLANPKTDVVALAGDGALLMTGLELLTAAEYGAAPLVCVLRDGELGQIAQFQRAALDRDTCSILHGYDLADFAKAVRCGFASAPDDASLEAALAEGFKATREGRPFIVDVAVDYSFKTFFTRGVVSTNFWRLSWPDRLRMLGRAAGRKGARALKGG